MIRIGVPGATGAMGRAVQTIAADRDDVEVTLRSSRDEHELDAVHPTNLADALAETPVDVFVDFTVPGASVDLVQTAADHGVGVVLGTTGFTAAQFDTLREHALEIPLLHAPNFSRGIHTLHAVVRDAVERLPAADIEITETHHNRKRDAPSGTAVSLLETIESVRPDATRVHGREGDAPREASEIGIHARRAGTITGEHEVLLALADEELRLTHRAESRDIFAAGALDAAIWLAEQASGWYSFDDALRDT